jgi:hypothetical protein
MNTWTLGAITMVAATSFACNFRGFGGGDAGDVGNGSGGGSSGYYPGNGSSASACIASSDGEACNACVSSACADGLRGVDGACTDYFSCVCPGGSFAGVQWQRAMCMQKAAELSCAEASGPFYNCVVQNCGDVCKVGSAQNVIIVVVGSGSGESGGSGDVTMSCTRTDGEAAVCSVYTGPSDQGFIDSCNSAAGTLGASCSTTDIVGCCSSSTGNADIEDCYYDHDNADEIQAECTNGGGTWLAGP